MDNQSMRNWSSMRGLKVMVEGEGRVIGTVEDFYAHSQTNEVYSFRVHTRLLGDFALPARMISAIEQDVVTIASEEKLEREFPPFPRGQALVGCKVFSESGTEIGTVRDVLLGITPVEALR